MTFIDPALERKINKDVSTQGYTVVNGPNWFFTVGMGRRQGRKDLLTHKKGFPLIHFMRLASAYYNGEIEIGETGKVLTESVMVTALLGPEPARFQLIEASEVDSAVFKEQLTSGLFQDHPFSGFIMVQCPDDDNRLFGEIDCRTERSVQRFLMDEVFELGERIKKKAEADKAKAADDILERQRVEKVLSKPNTPRNKRKKNKLMRKHK